MERKRVEQFEDLRVWQEGIALVKQVYLLTKQGNLSKDYGLRDQLQRSSVSIPTNIAEGFERSSQKEYLQFLNIAKGSAGEVRSLLKVALEVGYLEQSTYQTLHDQITQLSRMLSAQIYAIRNK
jgi:four helix bundle protein